MMLRLVVHVCRFHLIYMTGVAPCSLSDIVLVFFQLNDDVWISAFFVLVLSRCVRTRGSASWWSNHHAVAADIHLLTSSCLWSRHCTFHLWGWLWALPSQWLLSSSQSGAIKKNQRFVRFCSETFNTYTTRTSWRKKIRPHILTVSRQPTYVSSTFQRTWRQQAHPTTLIVPLAASACDSDVHTRYV